MRKLIIAMLFLLGLPDLILAEKLCQTRSYLSMPNSRPMCFTLMPVPFNSMLILFMYVQVPATGHLTAAMKSRRLLLIVV